RPRDPFPLPASGGVADARGRDVKNARGGGVRQTLETADNFATARRRPLRFTIAARSGAGQENAARQGLADDPAAGRGELFWEPQKAGQRSDSFLVGGIAHTGTARGSGAGKYPAR